MFVFVTCKACGMVMRVSTLDVGCDTEEHFIAGLEQAGKRRG